MLLFTLVCHFFLSLELLGNFLSMFQNGVLRVAV
jgi:hypothetical protein